MSEPSAIVVVGGGLAAAKAVEELREQGYDGGITVLAAEQHLPYERPPLSKDLLLGSGEEDQVFVHDRQWYADHDVDLRLGTMATGLDLGDRRVTTADGDVSYDRLLLATGAQPRRLALADDSGAPVAYLRTLDDSRALKEMLGRRLFVIGGGWIGLEVASAARNAGGEVTLVETQSLPLLGVMGERLAGMFADLHREHGVDLRLSTGIESISSDGAQARARLSDGDEVTADLVVVGIGAGADDRLAAAAGLAVDGGVLVDQRLRTSDEHVFAAGDVAVHDHPVLGRRIRVEHWDTAIGQGQAAARAMLGDETPYTRLPFFFTDQYDLGMEYVGSVGPDGFDDVVVRGDEAGRQCVVFWLKGGTVQAGMHVNVWDATDPIRGIVGRQVDPDRLADDTVPLADLAKG